MAYLIGVDGGGTGCRVAVSDLSGRILGNAKGGAANISTNLIGARQNILDAVDLAFADAELDPSEIGNSSAVLGLAGSNFGNYAAKITADLPFKDNHVVNDSRITLEGAIGGAKGCIAVIGTGSVFAARTDSGVHMLGGWSFLLGDDGGGATLGHDLLRLTILAADGVQEHSDLTRDVMAEFNNRIENIVETALNYSPRDFGQFAPRIVAAAKAGDRHGMALMNIHTELVQKSIDAAGFDPKRPFCMLGGLGQIYLESLPEKYRAAAHPPLGDALSGAIKMAKQYLRAS